jgi:N-acetylglucosaminyldiphosphoundecaprenol N-acetyl-beta-D-mannosaminyltransferase
MKKEIMGVELESWTAGEALEKILAFLDQEILSVCALVRMGMLLTAESDENYRAFLKELQMGILVDPEVKKAMEVEAEEEIGEESTFLNGLFLRISEKQSTLAVLKETREQAEQAGKDLKKQFPGLRLTGVLAMEEFEDGDDVVNHINALDADLLLADLPIPVQEEFVFTNRNRLDLKVWLGIGGKAVSGKKLEKMPGFFEKLIEKRMFKKKVNQYTRENQKNLVKKS